MQVRAGARRYTTPYRCCDALLRYARTPARPPLRTRITATRRTRPLCSRGTAPGLCTSPASQQPPNHISPPPCVVPLSRRSTVKAAPGPYPSPLLSNSLARSPPASEGHTIAVRARAHRPTGHKPEFCPPRDVRGPQHKDKPQLRNRRCPRAYASRPRPLPTWYALLSTLFNGLTPIQGYRTRRLSCSPSPSCSHGQRGHLTLLWRWRVDRVKRTPARAG